MKNIVILIFLIINLVSVSGIAGVEKTVVKHAQLSKSSIGTFKSHSKIINAAQDCISKSDDQPLCAYIYADSDRKSFVIEFCQPVGQIKPGLYLVRGDKDMQRFNWFNQQFMQWACEENTNRTNVSEYWGIRTGPKGLFSSLLYNFHINQNAGYYYLKLKEEGELIVLDEKVEDLI